MDVLTHPGILRRRAAGNPPAGIESLANGCDLLILPSTPDPLSISALAQIARSLPEGTNYRVLLTMVPPAPQKDGEQALEALKRNGFPVFNRTIRRYKAYIKASDLGVPVYQAPGGNTAWRDWKELSKELRHAI